MLFQDLAIAIEAEHLRALLVLLEGLLGEDFELLPVRQLERALFRILLDLFYGLTVDVERFLLGFPEPLVYLMLVHLNHLRHLNPLLLGRALAVHLLVDGLQVFDSGFAPFHPAVARAQLLLQSWIDRLDIDELRRANLTAFLQFRPLCDFVFRLAVPLSLVLGRRCDDLLWGGVPQE